MIKARNCITWSNQYVAHRDVKRIRRDANGDIEFGLKTYKEEKEVENHLNHVSSSKSMQEILNNHKQLGGPSIAERFIFTEPVKGKGVDIDDFFAELGEPRSYYIDENPNDNKEA